MLRILQHAKYENVLNSYVICAFPILLLVKGTTSCLIEKTYCDLTVTLTYEIPIKLSLLYLVTFYIWAHSEF
jgi:hypothetical protein